MNGRNDSSSWSECYTVQTSFCRQGDDMWKEMVVHSQNVIECCRDISAFVWILVHVLNCVQCRLVFFNCDAQGIVNKSGHSIPRLELFTQCTFEFSRKNCIHNIAICRRQSLSPWMVIKCKRNLRVLGQVAPHSLAWFGHPCALNDENATSKYIQVNSAHFFSTYISTLALACLVPCSV